MKKLFSFLVVSILCSFISNSSHAQLSKLRQKVKDKVNQRVDQKEDRAIDNALDSIDNATKVGQNKTAKSKGESV